MTAESDLETDVDDDFFDVLYVGADTEAASCLETALNDHGDCFTVRSLSDTAAVRTRLEAERPAAVVSDHAPPTLDGIDLIRDCRAADSELPVLLHTANGSEALASNAIAAGVTDYVPYEPNAPKYDELAVRIDAAIEKHHDSRTVAHSQQLFTALYNNPLLFGAVLDPDGTVRDINQNAADLPNVISAECEGRPFWEMPWWPASLDDVPDIEEHVRRAARGEIHQFQTPYVAGAEQRTVLGVLCPVEHDGEIRSLIALGQDCTELDRKQHHLEQLERVVQKAPIGITLADPDGDDTPLTYVNDRFSEVTGYEKSETVGRNCRFLQGKQTDEAPVTAMREAIANRETVKVELRNYRKDGTEFWNRVTIAPIVDEDGDTTTVVGFQEDVTDSKGFERELRQQNERLDRFASSVSHDLRGPLNIAQGRLELAQDDCESPHLDDIASAHERIDELIDDVLTLAHAETAGYDTEWLDVAEMATEAWKGIDTTSASLDVDTDQRIRGRDPAVRRLLENLLRNAVEHGGTGVTVTVRALDGSFCIADDGPGIDRTNRDKVFEPGFSDREGGTGLGLTLVADICESHGWTSRLGESAVGGTLIEITGVDTDYEGRRSGA
jgi:PAS domain S-box-containing protein